VSGVPDRTKRTPEMEQAFLDALCDGYSVNRAAKAAGIGRRTAYEWRDADPEFKQRWLEAVEAGTDTLEDEARDRAMDTSDTLLIFTLKARRPEKYRENVNLNHSGTITVTATNFAVIDAKAEEVKLIE
jgi:transposase